MARFSSGSAKIFSSIRLYSIGLFILVSLKISARICRCVFGSEIAAMASVAGDAAVAVEGPPVPLATKIMAAVAGARAIKRREAAAAAVETPQNDTMPTLRRRRREEPGFDSSKETLLQGEPPTVAELQELIQGLWAQRVRDELEIEQLKETNRKLREGMAIGETDIARVIQSLKPETVRAIEDVGQHVARKMFVLASREYAGRPPVITPPPSSRQGTKYKPRAKAATLKPAVGPATGKEEGDVFGLDDEAADEFGV